MANGAHHRDEGETAALASLLDPVALEARLADARDRRAAVLAAKAAPPASPELSPEPLVALPGLALRGAAVILAGLAGLATVVTAVSLLLARPAPAPDVVLTAAVPTEPGAFPTAPHPGVAAGWREATPSPPVLAGLVFASPAPPPPRPVRPAPLSAPASAPAVAAARVAAPSKARASRAPSFDEAAPALTRAVSSDLLPMISRSSALLPYPLVHDDDRVRSPRRATPKVVRQPEGLVRQITRAGQSVVRDIRRDIARGDPGESLARTIRRASAVLDNKARSGGLVTRHGPDKSERNAKARPGKGGSDKARHGGGGGSKGKGGGKGGKHGRR